MMVINIGFIPSAAHNLATIGNHYIIAECERAMFFYSSELQSLIVPESKYIVSDNIVLAIVLMKCATFASIYKVVLHHHAGTTLVGIKSPAAVVIAVYVVNMVVVHASARHLLPYTCKQSWRLQIAIYSCFFDEFFSYYLVTFHVVLWAEGVGVFGTHSLPPTTQLWLGND